MTSPRHAPLEGEVVVQRVRILHLTDDGVSRLCASAVATTRASDAALAVDARQVCRVCLHIDAERTVRERERHV